MYNQIKKMMDAYHTFASYPSYANIQTLMSAIKQGKLLMPMSDKTPKLSEQQLIDTFNNQLLNMSNTSPKNLSLNVQPRIGQGKRLISGKAKDVFPDDSIVVDGIEMLMANYYAYVGDDATKYIYFDVNKNEFIRRGFAEKTVVPINKLFNHNKNIKIKSHAPADNKLEARLNDSILNRVLDEVREKWETYVFPLNLCHGLTNWQEDGWQSVLKGDKK